MFQPRTSTTFNYGMVVDTAKTMTPHNYYNLSPPKAAAHTREFNHKDRVFSNFKNIIY